MEPAMNTSLNTSPFVKSHPESLHLSSEQVQRLTNFCAHTSCRLFEIADAIAGAGVSGFGVTTETKNDRHRFASVAAEVVKNLADLDRVGHLLELTGRAMQRNGFDTRNTHAAKQAFVHALKQYSQIGWTTQLEQDWSECFDACVQRMAFVSRGVQAVESQRKRAA